MWKLETLSSSVDSPPLRAVASWISEIQDKGACYAPPSQGSADFAEVQIGPHS